MLFSCDVKEFWKKRGMRNLLDSLWTDSADRRETNARAPIEWNKGARPSSACHRPFNFSFMKKGSAAIYRYHIQCTFISCMKRSNHLHECFCEMLPTLKKGVHFSSFHCRSLWWRHDTYFYRIFIYVLSFSNLHKFEINIKTDEMVKLAWNPREYQSPSLWSWTLWRRAALRIIPSRRPSKHFDVLPPPPQISFNPPTLQQYH